MGSGVRRWVSRPGCGRGCLRRGYGGGYGGRSGVRGFSRAGCGRGRLRRGYGGRGWRSGFLAAAGAILPFTCGGYDKADWDGDVDVEIAELAVEFSLIEIRDRMPAMSVVHGGLWIPLGDRISALVIAAAGKDVGQLDMKGGRQDGLATGRQGCGKDDFDNIDILGMVFHPGQLAVDAKFQTVHVSPLCGAGEIEVCFAIADPLFAEGGTVVLVSIGPAVDPNIFQCIGGVIDVLDADGSVEGMCGIVEGDVDGIIDLLLPILGLGVRQG